MASIELAEEVDFFLLMMLNLVKETLLSMEQIEVVPLSLIFCFLCWLLREIHKKVYLFSIRSKPKKLEDSEKTLKIHLDIAFNISMIPFAIDYLKLTETHGKGIFAVLKKRINSSFSLDVVQPIHTKLYFAFLSGYYLLKLSDIFLEKGVFDVEFIANQLVILFFISTFPLKCVQFGIAFICLLHIVDVFVSISHYFSLKYTRSGNEACRLFIYVFLLFHAIIWLFAYLYIFPAYFLLTSLTEMSFGSDMMHMAMYLLLNGSLISFYFLGLFNSIVSSLFLDFIKSKTSIGSLSNSKKETAISILEDKNELERIERLRKAKKKENLLMLYHTVKCSIRIKRKLKRIREKNKGNECSYSSLNYQENEINDVPQISEFKTE